MSRTHQTQRRSFIPKGIFVPTGTLIPLYTLHPKGPNFGIEIGHLNPPH